MLTEHHGQVMAIGDLDGRRVIDPASSRPATITRFRWDSGQNVIQPDRADRWTEGVIGLTLKEGQARPAPDEWGTIRAWAWGISRA